MLDPYQIAKDIMADIDRQTLIPAECLTPVPASQATIHTIKDAINTIKDAINTIHHEAKECCKEFRATILQLIKKKYDDPTDKFCIAPEDVGIIVFHTNAKPDIWDEVYPHTADISPIIMFSDYVEEPESFYVMKRSPGIIRQGYQPASPFDSIYPPSRGWFNLRDNQ